MLRHVEAPQLRHRLPFGVNMLLLEALESPCGRLSLQLLRASRPSAAEPSPLSCAPAVIRVARPRAQLVPSGAARRNPSREHQRAQSMQLPHSVAKIELQLHHRSARLKLRLLHLHRALAEMLHLTWRCLIGAATTANRRDTASSGHHALRDLAVSPRAHGVDQAPLIREVQEVVEHSGRPFPSRRRGGALDLRSLP